MEAAFQQLLIGSATPDGAPQQLPEKLASERDASDLLSSILPKACFEPCLTCCKQLRDSLDRAVWCAARLADLLYILVTGLIVCAGFSRRQGV